MNSKCLRKLDSRVNIIIKRLGETVQHGSVCEYGAVWRVVRSEDEQVLEDEGSAGPVVLRVLIEPVDRGNPGSEAS